VSPRNTSKECARCHGLIARYDAKHAPEGYTPGTPLAFCPHCGMKGNADRNASIVIGQRLLTRYQKHQKHHKEKPSTPLLLAAERDEKSSGVTISHVADSVGGSSISHARRRRSGKGHGTAHEERAGMVAHLGSIPTQLRL
jgi:hypothetical protein